MSTTDNERIELFDRIGRLEGARTNEATHIKDYRKDTDSGGGAKAFASILVLVAIIGGMAAIVRPIQQQIDFMSGKVDTLQIHASDGHPEKVQAEIAKVINRLNMREKDEGELQKRINKLEQDVAVLTKQMEEGTKDRYYGKDAQKDAELRKSELNTLQIEVNHLKEQIRNANIQSNYNN